MRRDKVHIEDYDSSWPAGFEAQQRVVTAALVDLLVRPVEHKGNTSVPGLPAKPIFDMLAVVTDYDAAAAALPRLADADWLLAPSPATKKRENTPYVTRRSNSAAVICTSSSPAEDGRTWRRATGCRGPRSLAPPIPDSIKERDHAYTTSAHHVHPHSGNRRAKLAPVLPGQPRSRSSPSSLPRPEPWQWAPSQLVPWRSSG
jgi:GrpB protein